MTGFYIVGVVVVFLAILLIGSLALAHDDENKYNILDLLMSLCILPWFSWLLILIVVLVASLKSIYKE